MTTTQRATPQLCTIDPCYVRGRHTDDGCDAGCKGCLPGLAMDGARICPWHADRALRDLNRLPQLDNDLTRALTRNGGASQSGRVTGTTTPGLELNPTVFEFRDHLRERLAAIVGYVAVERRFTGPPAWDVTTVCGWLRSNHDWLTRSRMAPTYVMQVDKLTRRAHGLAHPSGARRLDVGPCTEHLTSDDGERTPCPGTLTALIRDTASMLPSELTCDGPEPHTFAPHEWMALGRRLHGAAGIHPDAAQALTRKVAG